MDFIDAIEKASGNMYEFYKKKFVNYRGKTTDTRKLYTELVCEWLLNHREKLDEIKTKTRESSYYVPTHDGEAPTAGSNRCEELIAMQIYKQGHFDLVGDIIDYQTPLKNSADDSLGKIDLLSDDGETLCILELKEPDSHETMLRCVLEGYAYLKTVDAEKLAEDFIRAGIIPKGKRKIKAHPLVFVGGKQQDEMKESRPKLTELMKYLGITPLYVADIGGKFIITEN